ncbi:MAG: quinone oxidoreductase [Candidatus Protochlamydia sp.]|nr:quinone oxidoreductase [Candidatus Protochlamydia sp.]
MQAIYIMENGDFKVIQLQKRPKPIPKKGEALIELKRAGLNFVDVYMRMGNPAIPVSLPFIPGVEGSGIVKEIGDGVNEVRPGDRVAFVGHLGSYAEYSTVPAAQLIPLRKEISFDQGSAFPLQGMTAHYLVHDIYAIKAGDNVLVHAAAGGVGLLTVQWLKHLGARVIGTVSTNEKAKIAKEAGADNVIIYTEKDFVGEIKELTNGFGVDYIIDGVGKTTLTKDLDAIRKGGCICIFGLSSGAPDPIDAHTLQLKSIKLCGGNLMNYLISREELLRKAESVMEGIIEGWLKLKINAIFPLSQAGEAQHLLESRQTTGKLLLKIKD